MNRRAWTPDEVAYLHQWYPKKGPAWCAEKLHRPYNSVKRKASRLELNVGEVDGWVSVRDVERAAGTANNTLFKLAQEQGVMRVVGGQGRGKTKRALVPEAWADEQIALRQAQQEAEEARYLTLAEAAEVLGVEPTTVRAAVKARRGRYKALADARVMRGKYGRFLINPWDVRAVKEAA